MEAPVCRNTCGKLWEAVEWAEKYPWADSLPVRIAADPDLWLDHIRLITEKEEQARKERELDAAIVSDLPDLVLDLDFRLTLMEKFGF